MHHAHPLSYPDVVTLVLAFIAICALAVYEWRTRARAPRMLPENELPSHIAYAVRDCVREHISVRILGYSSSEARSHLRAYIKAKHQFMPDVQASIQREALIQSREHEARFPIYTD